MNSGKLGARVKRHWQLYLMLLPAVAYIAVFHYAPIYGLLGAFENFKPYKGYFGSEWVGLAHFRRFFASNTFDKIVLNTIKLSLYSLLAGFPMPIILALCLNYIPSLRFKKLVQNVTYAPHFVSIVVLVSMINSFFGLDYGLVNNIREMLGMERLLFLGDASMFPHLYVWSGVWQGVGWGSIIYISALTGVDPELHESAIVDGASILQRIRFIDIPCILPVAVTLLIMDAGKVMSVGFDKIYLMQNSLNLGVSEVISTYVYKRGILDAQYSYSTAVGLFTAVVNLILLLTVNTISKKLNETSIW